MLQSPGRWPWFLFFLLLGACQGGEKAAVQDVPGESPPGDAYRLAANVAPVAQQLTLRIDPAQEEYSGSTTITIEVSSPAPEIRLHAEGLDIGSLRLERDGAELPVAWQSGEHALLSITGEAAFAPGTYRLSIDFSNNFNTDGVGINRNEQDGDYYVFSQFEAVDAREAFPCFDEPGFKFPWQLTISVPQELLAITNSPEQSSVSADGWLTTTFAETPPLSSYLIAVAVGPFETVPIEGMSAPGRVIVPRGKSDLAAYAVETTPPLLAYLEEYFGEPYPFAKLDLIATFGAFSGAMEHPGAITYSDFFLLLGENASADQRQTLVRITAHELAHQWFGNLVTMQWWDDLWLNESFADWMADKTVAAVYPESGGETGQLRTTFRVMDSDARPTTQAIRRDFGATDNFQDNIFLAYYKGKSVLSMFERAVGEDLFRDGVVRYIRKYSRGNARADDLWAELGAVAEFELADGLAGFINQPGIPLVSVQGNGAGRYTFAQSRLLTGVAAEAGQPRWIIPVSYKYRRGDRLQAGEIILDGPSAAVDLGEGVDWILPNADQQGYYRWTVPADMLVRIGTDAAAHLNVRERMGMLSNLWALLMTDSIDAADFLATLRGMASDEDPDVLEAVLDQLNNVRQTFITPELRDEFAAYVRLLLTPVLDRFGTESLPDDSPDIESLRPQLLLWLDDYGRDPRARDVNAALTKRFLDGEISLSSALVVALRAEARRGDQALFDEMVKRFESVDIPAVRQTYLSAIGSFRDPQIVAQALEFTLKDSLRRNDIENVLLRIAAWPDNQKMLLDWLMNNDTALRERLPEDAMAFIPDAITTCSPEHMPTIKAFYGAPERAVRGIESQLQDSEAEVMECWELRQRELGSVSAYLESIAQ